MAKPNILVVDSDEGFGIMLSEGLKNSGHYSAICVHSGTDALQAVVEQNFDLVIIDVAVSDMKPPQLIKGIRDAKSDTKIMLIPLMGQDLSSAYEKFNINGILPKPFFVGDLPDIVDKAMGRTRQTIAAPPPQPDPAPEQTAPASSTNPAAAPASQTAAAPAAAEAPASAIPVTQVSSETIRFLRANETEILRALGDLNREVRAEAILLIAGADLIANSGMLGREECQKLAVLVAQSSQAAAQAATFLGERSGRFTQSLHEGGSYRLYTLTLTEGILLSLALSTNVPLGMIRHQSRQVAEELSKFIM